ncbi:hypothetical protein Ddc_05275 [Ditylenchus destructor]|nr:hypothetical protein Ddc_05275 [Ditylenchus destructor]
MTLAKLIIFVQSVCLMPALTLAQADRSLAGLISTRDIAELTQIATQLAAQTMQSNGEMLSKPGRPEIRPVNPLDQSPSQLIGQSLTNMWEPAQQQLAKTLMGQQPIAMALTKPQVPPSAASQDSVSEVPLFGSQYRQSKPRLGGLSNVDFSQVSGNSAGARSNGGSGIGSLMDLATTLIQAGSEQMQSNVAKGTSLDARSSGGTGGSRVESPDGGLGGGSDMARILSSAMTGNARGSGGNAGSNNLMGTTLKQFMPGAGRNFGLPQGEGCLPFIGEFMSAMYGNCVRQADEGTWDTWGKQITNALMGGKIDLLRASKESCKKGAEREQCGQLRKAVSECDIMGSIQLSSNMQRAISRCDEISGILDQNPRTVMQQMNGLINGEMAQGFLNNFLG